MTFFGLIKTFFSPKLLKYIINIINDSSTQNDGDRKESTSESSLESSSGYSSQTAISNATPDEGEYNTLIYTLLCLKKL